MPAHIFPARRTELLTDESKGDCRFVEPVMLDGRHLDLLATVVQSDHCAHTLIESTLPMVFSQAIYEFCVKELKNSPPAAAPAAEQQRQGETPTRG